LAAFADNVYLVTPKHIKAAIADSEFGAEKAKKAGRRLWLLGFGGVLLLGLALGYFGQWLYLKQVTPTTSAQMAEQGQPEHNVAKAKMGDGLAKSQPVNISDPTASTPNAAEALPDAQRATTQDAVSSVNQSAVISQDILLSRLSATQQWMRALPKDTVTIQVLGASDEQQLRLQLATLAQTIELDKIFVYQTKANQQTIYTVLYGTFADRFSANEALKQLPESLQNYTFHGAYRS
jgi:MSHA biogenesis protein MshM